MKTINKSECINPVFQVVGALDWNERRDLCVIPYVRIYRKGDGEFQTNVARGKALEQLKHELADKYKVDPVNVRFHFWANSSVTGCGSPQEIGEAFSE